MKPHRTCRLLLMAAVASACASTEGGFTLATADRGAFDAQVWPILVRDCGFSACHGSESRFFLVYARAESSALSHASVRQRHDPCSRSTFTSSARLTAGHAAIERNLHR